MLRLRTELHFVQAGGQAAKIRASLTQVAAPLLSMRHPGY